MGALNGLLLRGRRFHENIAKHPRRRQYMDCQSRGQASAKGNPRPPCDKLPSRGRDSRSFADVAKGMYVSTVNHPLILSAIKEVQDWTNNAILVGEIKNFDILCNFSSMVKQEGFDIIEMKYLGGMQVLVMFNSDRSANNFKANKNIWLKWFVWMEHFGKNSTSFERIAWIKITGLPLHALDDSNTRLIDGYFGKVLVNCNPFWSSHDVSHGKICILTASRKKINDEVSMSIDGNIHRLGVFEVDDDWTPFKKLVSCSTSDSDSEVELDDDDGVSDTWKPDDLDLEEGEINQINPDHGGNDSPPIIDAPALPAVDDVNCFDQGPHDGDNEGLHGDMENENVVILEANSSSNVNGINSPNNNLESGVNLVNPTLGRFGDSSRNGPASGPFASSPKFELGDSNVKRRQTKKKKNGDCRSNSKIASGEYKSIDLNRDACRSQRSNSSSPVSSASISCELENTIAVGNQVGFQIGTNCIEVTGMLLGDGGKKKFS
ncbi:unnamed protein product [Lactuca virosa]|uniref:DUF4283 domain-containing protein n=1 Tax=Lactuca virosa TaxID=75947 RepID=A0AAU9NMN9_9ASTR|nr:unnamed protein product [Lactuca virosa]